MGRMAPDIVPLEVAASDSAWTPLHLFDFSGGMISDFPDSAIGDNQWKNLTNYFVDENNSIVTRPPFQPYNAATNNSALSREPRTFFWTNLNGADYLFSADVNGAVARWTGGAWLSIIDGEVSPNYRVDFVKFTVNDRDDLIICNGPGKTSPPDNPKRWDTTELATDLGLAPPEDVEETITGGSKGNPNTIATVASTTGAEVGKEFEITDSTDSEYDGIYTLISFIEDTSITFALNSNGFSNIPNGTIHYEGIVEQTSGGAQANERGIQFNGTYTYSFTFFYESTTSTKFGESGPCITHSVTITDCDEGTDTRATVTIHTFSGIPTDVTKINVYRSPADMPTGPFLLVGTITDLDTDWIDNTPVGEEGVETPSDAGTPPRLKFPVVANGRLWGVGMNSLGKLGNKLVYSENASVDMFLAANAFYATEDITGIAYFNRNIYVFTRKAMWFLLDADPVKNEFLKIADRGASSHHSIVDIGRGLVFQGTDNIYFFDHNTQNRDGDFPIPIADGLSNRIRNINATKQPNSAGALFKNLYILSYTASGDINDATIVWQINTLPTVLGGETAGWSQYDWRANHLQTFGGFLYTADAANKYIQEHGVFGVYDQWTKTEFDAQRNRQISTTLISKRFHFSHPWTDKHFSSITAVGESSGVTMPVTLSLNNGDYSRGTSLVLGTFVEPLDNARFGSATFWTLPVANPTDGSGEDPGFFATDNFTFRSAYAQFGSGAVGKNAQLTLIAANSADTKIIGLTLHHKETPLPR